jgi:two-component system, probable response regulator PhcQ
MHRIMAVDDSETVLHALGKTLRRHGEWEAELFSDACAALRRARTCVFDAFVCDVHMPDCNGVDLLAEMRVIQPHACRILLSGTADTETLIRAINDAGAFRFFGKPWQDQDLIEALQQGLQHKDRITENRILADWARERMETSTLAPLAMRC